MSTPPAPPLPQVRPGLRVSGSVFRSDIGRDRQANDDGLLCMNRTPLFAVADGKGGPEAARTALATLHERATELSLRLRRAAEDNGASQRIAVERTLGNIFAVANEAVFAASRAVEDRQLACTLVAATVAGYHAHIAHVGDARAYLHRGGTLRCLTSDHTLAALQLRQGLINRTEFEMSPFRKTLAQAFGVTPVLDTDLAEVRVQPGDRLFLCTNGVTRAMPDDVIAAILGEPDANGAADALMQRLREAGAPDNASFIIFDLDGPAGSQVGAEELEQRVRGAYLFEGLSDPQWMALSSCLEMIELAQDATLVTAGEAPPGLVVIGHGRLAERLPGAGPQQPHVREYQAGDALGALQLSLPEGTTRVASYDVVALEPTTCFTLDRARFREFITHNPNLGGVLALRQLEQLGSSLARVTSTIGAIADTIQGRQSK